MKKLAYTDDMESESNVSHAFRSIHLDLVFFFPVLVGTVPVHFMQIVFEIL